MFSCLVMSDSIQWRPASCASALARMRGGGGASHRLLKFEHELIYCSAARRLDREVARILRVAPEIAFGDKLESNRFDFAAQRTLFDAVKGLADRNAVAGLCGMVGDHKKPARPERGVQFAVHLSAIDTHVRRVVVEKQKCDEV